MKKRILQTIPYSYHIHAGGLEKIAQTLSDGLNQSTSFVCYNIASDIRRWHTEPLGNFEKDTVFVPSYDLIYNFPIPKFWSREFWKTIQKIKEQKPDIIQTHTRFFIQSFMGWIIAKRLGCKRVHVEHGSGFVTGYSRYIKLAARCFDWTLWRWIFRQCDEIITISHMHKKFIQKFTRKKPVVIYNPIDYTPHKKIHNTIPHIGFVGRLVTLKWVDLLIHALKQIEEKKRICTIVWEGDQRKDLELLVHELWLQKRIIFVWADDRVNRLHKFDIFVNPSHQEWLPTTVVEALLASCIVVATDVWWTREISNKHDLVLVKPGSVEDLGAWIVQAYDSLKNGWDSLDTIKIVFNPENTIHAYTDIYTSILQK